MDTLTTDCPHCRSAGSIEFGLCQVCLREPSFVGDLDVLVTLPVPASERAV